MPGTRQKRIFSFVQAAELLPEVRQLTEQAISSVASLRARAEAGEAAAELQRQADRVVQDWMLALQQRGVEVKGLWLIDFDNGSGYYCWSWPEPALEYYHSYEDGFGGRMRIH